MAASLLAAAGWATAAPAPAMAPARASASAPSGGLAAIRPEGTVLGPCPLRHTSVKAQVTAFQARVTVTQEYHNPYPDRIEAVYTFPLPQNAAVDDMTLLIGGRRIKGQIKTKEDAQRIYDNAKQRGHTASLLDQQRPNIFTQAVANIGPGEAVKIEISYFETLTLQDGSYRFVFPMVVGPRYSPRQSPDASRISPPVAAVRAGHDIDLTVEIDAGVPLDRLFSPTHEVAVARHGIQQATVALKDMATIPNKDFILQYDILGKQMQDAVLTHVDARGGFFSLLLTPPDSPRQEDITPKELVFVLDTSGSMHGFPLDKAKEAMRLALAGLHPRDTFNLITFAGDTHLLFPQPVPATAAHLAQAQQFLDGHRGGGGTEMMKAIRAALGQPGAADRVRVVCFMTDGYVGNEAEILTELQRNPHARVFSFGIGSSVNRYLLDKMAEHGRGEVEYVGLQDDGSAAAKRFHERVRSPLLTNVRVEITGVDTYDVLPRRVPDLFSAKPLAITGRYRQGGTATIRITGQQAGKPWARDLRVTLPALPTGPQHQVLATWWARQKVDALLSLDLDNHRPDAAQTGTKAAVTQLGLDFRLMTPYTSFVAVEERRVTEGGTTRTIQVPVEMPEGVSHDAVFGREQHATYRALNSPGTSGVVAGAPPMLRQEPWLERRSKTLAPVPRPDAATTALDAPLLALLQQLESGGALSKTQSAQVVQGRLAVVVTLRDAKQAATLARYGLVVKQPTSTLANGTLQLAGTISYQQLRALANDVHVAFVRLAADAFPPSWR